MCIRDSLWTCSYDLSVHCIFQQVLYLSKSLYAQSSYCKQNQDSEKFLLFYISFPKSCIPLCSLKSRRKYKADKLINWLNSTKGIVDSHNVIKIGIFFFYCSHMFRLAYCSLECHNNISTTWKRMLLIWMKLVLLYDYIWTDNIYILSSSSYSKCCDCHYSVCKAIMVTGAINSEKLWAVSLTAHRRADLEQEVALALDKSRMWSPIFSFQQ